MNESHEMLISLIPQELFIYYYHHILQSKASKIFGKKNINFISVIVMNIGIIQQEWPKRKRWLIMEFILASQILSV
jgi:hypothetical protein